MKRLICFLLCIIVCLGLSFGCVITSEGSLESNLEESIPIESEPIQEETSIPRGILSLQEAFDLGVLTHEDLLSIAYHNGSAKNNEEIGDDFKPIEKPEMTEDVVLDIKNSLSYALNSLDILSKDSVADDFGIEKYYAFVNGYYVLQYTCIHIVNTQDVKRVVVDGVKFGYTNPIVVVQQKQMFMVAEAKKAYAEAVVYAEPNVAEVGVFIELYGVFGDCLVGLFETGNDHVDVAVKVNVGGYVFCESPTRFLLVWKDGELASLNWAYENGWITMENIAQAHETYSLGKGERV